MVFFELSSRMREYYAFTKKEVRDLAIAIFIIGFIFSFREWGTSGGVDVLLGFRNFVLMLFITALSFFVHQSVHRIYALFIGFKAEFKLWWGGLIASLILAFATNGIVQLVLPGGMVASLLVRHRLGQFRYGLNYWENGFIAMVGPLSSLALAFIAKIFLYVFPHSWFFEKLLLLNVIFAICTMLPIPPLDGVNTFFAGRLLYVTSFFGIAGAAVLIYFSNIAIAIVGGVIVMLIGTIVYYVTFENPPK